MSRNLLILAMLVFGTGCSVTRPLLSTVVVTPPGLSFRQLPRGDAWHWTAVAVTYPPESMSPAPCAPAPVRSVELVTLIEEGERPALRPLSGPVPSETTVVPVPPVNVPASAPPIIAHLEHATSPQPAPLPIPSVPPAPLGITPIVQTASTATLPAPPVRVESPPPNESHWKPATRIGIESPAQTCTAMRCDQDETHLPEVRLALPAESLSPPVPVTSDLSELLTEIREQRQLIEALQRELTRERSADDAAIEELEAAVENLLVQTKTTPSEMPITLRK